jgi:hypothetical protein
MTFALHVLVAVLAAFVLVIAHFQHKFNDEVLETFKAVRQMNEVLQQEITLLHQRIRQL